MKSSRDDSRTLTAFAALLTGNLILVANKRGEKTFSPSCSCRRGCSHQLSHIKVAFIRGLVSYCLYHTHTHTHGYLALVFSFHVTPLPPLSLPIFVSSLVLPA